MHESAWKKSVKSDRNCFSADWDIKERGPGGLCIAPKTSAPTRVLPPTLSPVWVMSSAEQGSEDQRIKPFPLRLWTLHRNVTGIFILQTSFWPLTCRKQPAWNAWSYTTPLLIAFFSPSYVCLFFEWKTGQCEEIHLVCRPLFCLTCTEWFYYVWMAVRCSFIWLPYRFRWSYWIRNNIKRSVSFLSKMLEMCFVSFHISEKIRCGRGRHNSKMQHINPKQHHN